MMRQKLLGLSLIELMMALTIFTILLCTLSTIYLALKKHQQILNELSHDHENTRIVMHVLSQEIRSAGFMSGPGSLKLSGTANTLTIHHPGKVITYFVAKTKRGNSALFVRDNKMTMEIAEDIQSMKLRYAFYQAGSLVTLEANAVQDWTQVLGVSIKLVFLKYIGYAYIALRN